MWFLPVGSGPCSPHRLGGTNPRRIAGVIYHQLGSLAVLLNSMRLLAFERTDSRTLPCRGAAKTVEAWFERFSIDTLLHGIGHRWKYVGGQLSARVLVPGAARAVQIESGEVGVVRRFGE